MYQSIGSGLWGKKWSCHPYWFYNGLAFATKSPFATTPDFGPITNGWWTSAPCGSSVVDSGIVLTSRLGFSGAVSTIAIRVSANTGLRAGLLLSAGLVTWNPPWIGYSLLFSKFASMIRKCSIIQFSLLLFSFFFPLSFSNLPSCILRYIFALKSWHATTFAYRLMCTVKCYEFIFQSTHAC